MPSKKSQGRPSKPPNSSSAPKPARAAPNPSKDPPALEISSPGHLRHQQLLLDIFTTTFDPVLSSHTFDATLQEIKQALYNREFARAFGSETYLDVYAARWSPTRALCYGEIFGRLREHLESLADASRASVGGAEHDGGAGGKGGEEAVSEPRDQAGESAGAGQGESTTAGKTLRVLSVGGAAAEIVAFASFISASPGTTAGDITLLDNGPWGSVVQRLHRSVTSPPPLSQYASAAARESNCALVSGSRLRSNFANKDVLSLSAEQLRRVIGSDPLLLTLLFTLNELYTSGGIGTTTGFLRSLTSCIPLGSLLLVVDSPGSYSEAAVGKEAKKYPMQWLLDHTLLTTDKLPPNGCQWEKLESEDSIWFRIAEGLRYPISLENMRYQMHLYRAVRRDALVG